MLLKSSNIIQVDNVLMLSLTGKEHALEISVYCASDLLPSENIYFTDTKCYKMLHFVSVKYIFSDGKQAYLKEVRILRNF